MDKCKLISSDKYQNAHGCKVATSNDDLNILMDEICKVMDISMEGDNLHDVQNYGKNYVKVKQQKMVRGTNLKLYLLFH